MDLHRSLNVLRQWAWAGSVVLLAACGGGGGDSGQAIDEASAERSSEPAGECGSSGFPCSLDKVPLDVLERGEALADQLIAMLDKGSSISAALDFIRSQPDVADAASSEVVLRFRLKGGRDVLIFEPGAVSPVKATASRAPAVAPAPPKKVAQAVVGTSATNKRALVLAPFKYFFAPDDDGAAVAQLLEKTRGYGGNVTYLENATMTAATVGIQQFVGWEAFDVIHVTSHGARVCDLSRCVSVILTGDVYSSAADLLKITETGVNTARRRGSDERLLALSPEFFKKHYPAGLDRKIIFFNACQTYAEVGAGLSDVLLGNQSVFLGWTDVVQSDAAVAAALALFQDLSVHGVTVDSALDSLGPLAFNHHMHEARDVNALLLLDKSPNSAMRLREVVTLEQPNGGGVLSANATVQAVGTAQDGLVDGVPYSILIEGIPASQQDSAIVTFTTNGFSSTPQAVTIGERVGETGWRLTGQIPYIDVSPEQTVEMVAIVTLPEGGTSEHRVSVRLSAQPVLPPESETWVGEAVSHFDDNTPEGMVHITRIATVTFKQSPATIGGRYKVLRSTGGSLKWSRSGTIKTLLDGDCAYSSGSVDVPIGTDDGEIIIDTAASPDSYALSGYTQGVTVRIAENCGSYAFSTRAGGAWAPAIGQGDGFRASPDGTVITGTTGANMTSWTWTFHRQ